MKPESMRIAIVRQVFTEYEPDGDMICARLMNFENLQESPAGFGRDEDSAFDMLIKDKDFLRDSPNYPEDLNAILPLLPVGTTIIKTSGCIIRDGKGRFCEGGPLTIFSNQSLALAACEFYLKWKGLWKE